MLCITGYKTQSSLFVALVSKLDCETRGMIVTAFDFLSFRWHPIKPMYIQSSELSSGKVSLNLALFQVVSTTKMFPSDIFIPEIGGR